MIQRFLTTTMAVVCCVSMCSLSAAQVTSTGHASPISKPGGYASTELQTIYNMSIGTGYSVNSVNSNLLAGARARNINVGQSQMRGPASVGPRLGLGVGASVAGKPFQSFSPSPTVSPYLNLFREDREGGGDLNYNTLVRPQLQQQQFNQQVQRQNMELQRRLQAISAQSDFNPRGSESQYPTGHQTVFRYYGRFYPAMNARYRR
jgi:hypothetical protein